MNKPVLVFWFCTNQWRDSKDWLIKHNIDMIWAINFLPIRANVIFLLSKSLQNYTKSLTNIFEHGFDLPPPSPGLNNVKRTHNLVRQGITYLPNGPSKLFAGFPFIGAHLWSFSVIFCTGKTS